MKKSFVLGFLLATLLFSAIPVGAVVQEYILTSTASKLVVDGVEVKNDTLPMMSYNGYNYIPASSFRDICDKIGVGFEWDNTAKAIEIDTSVATAETTIASTGGDIVSDVPLNKYGLPDFSKYTGTKPEIEDDGTNMFLTYESERYIKVRLPSDRQQLVVKPFFFRCPIIDGKVSNVLQLVSESQIETNVLIEEIPFTVYSDFRDYYIQYDYYLNTILPLTK